MMTVSSLVFLMLCGAIVVASNAHGGRAGKTITPRMHRAVCLGAGILGCLARLLWLDSLPQGISAEEALVGVQAKALWQTGGFLFDGGLTTQLAQWTGESSGPLLATLTAPFVGCLGMSALSVRLPLALLSCLSIPAAYGLGRELSGKRAGRWCLTIYALCPYFVLSARLTYGANAAVHLLPIAVYGVVRGMRESKYLYPGMLLMALTAYAQDMYFFIAPAAIVAAAWIACTCGGSKRHALLSAGLGLVGCVPALLTLWVNLTGQKAFVLLGTVGIPRLNAFDKTLNAMNAHAMQSQLWDVVSGGFFQALALGHQNVSSALFSPDGMGALYYISLPLMLLGAFSMLKRRIEGRTCARQCVAARRFVMVIAAITLVFLVLFGSIGIQHLTVHTSVLDYSALFLFDALMMAAGFCEIERKSAGGIAALTALTGASFVSLCLFMFGGAYQEGANVYFRDFETMAQRAGQIQRETGAKVNVTSKVYPHCEPNAAAEMMYLYATDADMRTAEQTRGVDWEIAYIPNVEQPDSKAVYLVATDEIAHWDLTAFAYEEDGRYALLYPQP